MAAPSQPTNWGSKKTWGTELKAWMDWVEDGTDIQTQGDILDDLNTLGAAASDGQFIVATGAGAFAYESTTTARTSLGVGTGDSPTFATVVSTGNATIDGLTVGKGPNSVATNAVIGVGAGASITSGTANTVLGNTTLAALTDGASVTAIGYGTLAA